MSRPYRKQRPIQTRPVNPVIHVVCDDTHTAVEYFNVLKAEVKDRKVVKIVPAPKHGASAAEVLELAISPSPDDAQDASFVLIDADTNADINGIRKKAGDKNVAALFSKPCFEIWTLAHLQDTGEAFTDCNAVLSRLKHKWKEEFGTDLGPKAQASFEKLSSKRQTAINHCKRRNPDKDQSWTEVWRAVEKILLP